MKRMIVKWIRYIIKLMIVIIDFPSVKMSIQEAEEKISKVYEKKELFSKKDIQNLETDENIDMSIVVPVYNAEKFLKKCMDSIVEQETKYHFEVIAVNDGSKDKSIDILNDYEDKYDFVKVINQENGGAAKARNNGINHARGRYISFIDSDDFIDKSFVEIMLERAFKNDLDIAMCSYYEYDFESEKILCEKRRKEILIKGKLGDEILKLKGYNCMKIFKRELWNEIRQPEGFWYEDCMMRIILMRMCSSFEYIDVPLYYYTVHKSSISRNKANKRNLKTLDHLFLLQELLRLSESLNLSNDRETLYKIIVYELGPVLWLRTRELSEENKKCAFVIACDIIEKYKTQRIVVFENRYLEKAFERRDYYLWKLANLYIMLGVKCKDE